MGKVLLVVDDSRTIRGAVELIFEGTEYRIISKETGGAGLAWMRAHTPDLILVDERMPDMDGYEFGSKVKADPNNEDVPILLLACQDGPDESKADTADLDGYVNKPFGSQELVTLVEMLTGSSQISQMPLSFKEQLVQRQRERKERLARGDSAASEAIDELADFESALASVSREEKNEKNEPKKDEPVVEIPLADEESEPVAPVKLEIKPVTADIRPPSIDLKPPSTDLKPADLKLPTVDLKPPTVDIKPPPATAPVTARRLEPIPDAKPEPTPPPRVNLAPPDDDEPDEVTPLPRIASETPPPPRFPPPQPLVSASADLAMPLPPRRDISPSRRAPPSTLGPLPPPPPAATPPPPLRASVREEIEVPIEAPVPMPPLDPPYAPPPTPPPVPPPVRERSVEVAIEAPVEAGVINDPAEIDVDSSGALEKWVNQSSPVDRSNTIPPAPRSASRGILFALLALAVIGGLVAFYFVSS